MTTTDKTGEKLVDSMRKTKAAAASDTSDTSQSRAQAPQTKRSRPQAKNNPVDKRASGGAGARGGDPYQSGRRIWPD